MSLASILKSVNKGFLKNVLEGAGLTLVSSGSLLVIFNQMLTTFKSNLNSVSADILALAHLAGFDVFFSLVLGAYVTRMVQNSGSLTLRKK